jgi:hypothetical protein
MTMRKVTDMKEARELLSKYDYMMYNDRIPEGSLERFDELDINNIIDDMNHFMPSYSATMHIDEDGMIIVEYPAVYCRLESVN